MNTKQSSSAGQARVKRPERHQVEWRPLALEQCLPSDHQARVVWRYVDSLDLSPLYSKIKAVEGVAGRDAVDPKILLALWMFATIEGISSARQIARLCERDMAYLWICGDVGVNHHLVSDFRTAHGDVLDGLLTDTVATLLHQGLVTLETVGQDGMRVRASAGSGSFRRRATLQKCHQEAQQQVERLRQERESQSEQDQNDKRRQAARERVAREREARVAQALEELDKLQKKKKPSQKEARASTTDPEARKMKMADGGYRPAYNVQLATDTQTQVITGVGVTNSGGDQGKMAPMVEQHQARYGKTPDEMLADGGYAKKEDIIAVSEPNGSTTVYAPVQVSKTSQRDAHEPRADDKPAVAEWRKRMATPEAKEIYKQRAATAECVNAIARNRGLQQFRVRGQPKVLAAMLWYVLAHNLRRTLALRAEAAQQS
jgi:transposase